MAISTEVVNNKRSVTADVVNAEASNVPLGYKQTEVGVIPLDWNCYPVSAVAASQRNAIVGGPFGSDLVSKDYVEVGVPVIRGQNMNGHWIQGPYVFVTALKARLLSANLAHPGDIVFTQRGTLGQVSLVPELPYNAYLVSQSQMKVTLNRNLIDPIFLFHVFSGSHHQRLISDRTIQTGVPHINLGILRDIPIQVPSLREQCHIAEVLEDMDELLRALEALIAKKRAIKEATMQQLLTGKTRLPGFDREWGQINMTSDSILKARIGWQGLTTAEYRTIGDYYLVTGTDFAGGRVNWETCHFVDRSRFVQDRNIQLVRGDVLLTKDGTIGKAGYVDTLPGPATLNSGIFVIRPKADAYVPLYMFYVLTSQIFEDFLSRLQAGSTISHLYQKDFVGFTFAAPALDEQLTIAGLLSDLDTEIAALEARLHKTRAIKQGMVQQLLTGRIRLVKPQPAEAKA